MEQFIIIDAEKKIIKLMGQINKDIPFAHYFTIPLLISNIEKVHYISEYSVVSKTDIVNGIYSVIDESDTTSKVFVRSTLNVPISVPDLKLFLMNQKDIKEIDVESFEKSLVLCNFIKDGKIEVISSKNQPTAPVLVQKPKKDTNSILVNDSVDSFLDRINNAEDDPDLENMQEVDDNEEVVSESDKLISQFGITD
jgi:hypothetical protein